MREFGESIRFIQLIDVDINKKYTWIYVWRNASSRTDRIPVDKDFVEGFHNLSACCGDRELSDYFPIIL